MCRVLVYFYGVCTIYLLLQINCLHDWTDRRTGTGLWNVNKNANKKRRYVIGAFLLPFCERI